MTVPAAPSREEAAAGLLRLRRWFRTFAFADELAEKRQKLREVEEALAKSARGDAEAEEIAAFYAQWLPLSVADSREGWVCLTGTKPA